MLSSVEPQNAVSGPMRSVNSTWEKLKARLQSEWSRVHAEITHYPTPIPACDAHFNYLLEERARISEELNRLQATARICITAEDSIKQIEDFVRASGYIDDDTKQAITYELRSVR